MYFAPVAILGFKFFLLIFEAKYLQGPVFKLLNTWAGKVFGALGFLCTKYLPKHYVSWH